MIIEKTNKLTEDQMARILNLENAAFREDGLENHAFLSNEINFNKKLPCFYMGYEKDELVTFLTTFIPTSYEAEIKAVTHPEYRRKGYFKKLFEAAKEILLTAGVNKALLVVEPKSKSGVSVIKTFEDVKLHHSEYKMSYSDSKALIEYPDLQLIQVNNENREIFTEITHDAFPELEGDSNFIDAVINSKNRKGFIVYKKGVPVGVFDYNYKVVHVFLYGLGIATLHRGKGFGKELVKAALIEGFKKSDKIVLDVDSENPRALNLYKKCGFQIDFQVDYYRYGF